MARISHTMAAHGWRRCLVRISLLSRRRELPRLGGVLRSGGRAGRTVDARERARDAGAPAVGMREIRLRDEDRVQVIGRLNVVDQCEELVDHHEEEELVCLGAHVEERARGDEVGDADGKVRADAVALPPFPR